MRKLLKDEGATLILSAIVGILLGANSGVLIALFVCSPAILATLAMLVVGVPAILATLVGGVSAILAALYLRLHGMLPNVFQ